MISINIITGMGSKMRAQSMKWATRKLWAKATGAELSLERRVRLRQAEWEA